MYEGEYCILREETVRERRGSYSGFCCRLYPFICWIIIKEGPGNFSGGRSPHWVNHVNLCLSCIVCLLCFCFCICFILLLRGPVFLRETQEGQAFEFIEGQCRESCALKVGEKCRKFTRRWTNLHGGALGSFRRIHRRR
jgi:hypothetical protein